MKKVFLFLIPLALLVSGCTVETIEQASPTEVFKVTYETEFGKAPDSFFCQKGFKLTAEKLPVLEKYKESHYDEETGTDVEDYIYSDGWMFEDGRVVKSGDTVNGNITLYCRWSAIPVNVSWKVKDSDAEIFHDSYKTQLENALVELNGIKSRADRHVLLDEDMLAPLEIDDYEFAGWYIDDVKVEPDTVALSRDTVFYGKWTRIPAGKTTVVYHSNYNKTKEEILSLFNEDFLDLFVPDTNLRFRDVIQFYEERAEGMPELFYDSNNNECIYKDKNLYVTSSYYADEDADHQFSVSFAPDTFFAYGIETPVFELNEWKKNFYKCNDVSITGKGFPVLFKGVCWNTEPDGSGVNYYHDDVILLDRNSSQNTFHLYAVWDNELMGNEKELFFIYPRDVNVNFFLYDPESKSCGCMAPRVYVFYSKSGYMAKLSNLNISEFKNTFLGYSWFSPSFCNDFNAMGTFMLYSTTTGLSRLSIIDNTSANCVTGFEFEKFTNDYSVQVQPEKIYDNERCQYYYLACPGFFEIGDGLYGGYYERIYDDGVNSTDYDTFYTTTINNPAKIPVYYSAGKAVIQSVTIPSSIKPQVRVEIRTDCFNRGSFIVVSHSGDLTKIMSQ